MEQGIGSGGCHSYSDRRFILAPTEGLEALDARTREDITSLSAHGTGVLRSKSMSDVSWGCYKETRW